MPSATCGWPLLGALPAFVQQQTGFLTSARQEYGDIHTLDLGLMKAIMLNNPAHIQLVLRDQARNYTKGGRLDQILSEILGNGLPFSTGDFWRRQHLHPILGEDADNLLQVGWFIGGWRAELGKEWLKVCAGRSANVAETTGEIAREVLHGPVRAGSVPIHW